ncbi:NACHT domain-containing protein [Mycobacterium rhizamassiliense]|uniref:NACHT domain-containing protein n=1 Tax=Mycobacterium rhizamassiliense TaxID=1841860 RepID=UPI0012FFB4ED|nr:HNH endonuclease [Mycobacterium rhizamassiliense]
MHQYDNLILLCPTHHGMVDANNGAAYSVDDLVAMRQAHEKQAKRRSDIDTTIQKYIANRYAREDKVLFEQAELHGPSVDSMFVDVPFACKIDAAVAELMMRIAKDAPGDSTSDESADGYVVTGAAQALLNPGWKSNALLVGGPGQGKSTLLQYICQFYRARLLGNEEYTGQEQQLQELTSLRRVPIRLDLRDYANWASRAASLKSDDKQRRKRSRPRAEEPWKTIEEYIAENLGRVSGGRSFTVEDLGFLVSTRPVLLAFDGLDEVANLKFRELVSSQIVDTHVRLNVDAHDLTMLVATRPGGVTSLLWSSDKFPKLNLRRLTFGLRLQYLQRWAVVAKLSEQAAERLQSTFLENQNLPHIRELASYPMQLAILLHLLQRRQLLPQRRTDLYSEYFKTFLDREQTEDKEPLLAEERQVIEDIHAYIGWYIHSRAEEGTSSGSIKRTELKAVLERHLEGRKDGQALARELFSALTTRVLCLVERDPGSGEFQFDVQSLREYFAAVYLFDEAGRDSRDDCLIALLKRPYWSNVSRFFVGMYSKGEVRGMRSVLEDIAADGFFGLHPILRTAATLFLNDRTYEGQKDSPIQEIVDFVLDGPGVVLAEDGLLDVAGAALEFSDRAGRQQALRHLQARLLNNPEPGIASALVASLRRHANKHDDLTDWWWDRYDETTEWLKIASDLGVLGDLNRDREQRLMSILSNYKSDSCWATVLLSAGGYSGFSDDILGIVKAEINDGAAEAYRVTNRGLPVGRMVISGVIAMMRSGAPIRPAERGLSRTRLRGKSRGAILSAVVECAMEVLPQRSINLKVDDWRRRLTRVAEVWGDGWVLRQGVAIIPEAINLDQLGGSVASERPGLQVALARESEARTHRKDASWWKQQLNAHEGDFELRSWLFSLLTVASSGTVIELAPQLGEAIDALAPRHFVGMRDAIRQFRKYSIGRELVLQDALRLNRIILSPKALWMVRAVSTEGSIVWIDKRLAAMHDEVLSAEIGDLRGLVLASRGGRVFKFETFKGIRAGLPAGGWASEIKLGALSATLAERVLKRPHEWPGDLVQRAVESVEDRMLSPLDPVSVVAGHENWFAEPVGVDDRWTGPRTRPEE